jgi:hypothetical protein
MKAIVVGAGGITGDPLDGLTGLGEVCVVGTLPVRGAARHEPGDGDRQVGVSAIVAPPAFRRPAAAGCRRAQAPGPRP